MRTLVCGEQSQRCTDEAGESNWLDSLVSFAELVLDRWHTHAQLTDVAVVPLVLLALSLCAVPFVWRIVRQAVTIVHELGHAVTARAMGRKVEGIQLHTDTSGVMISRGRSRGLGMVITAAAGYPAPAVLAGLMALLAGSGYTGAALTLYQLFLVLGVFLASNMVGLFSMLVSLLATGVIWWWGSAELLTATMVVLCVFYVIGAMRTTVDVALVHFRHSGPTEQLSTDAQQASASMLLSPRPKVWLLIFAVVSMIAAAMVAQWLIFGIG